MNYKNILALTLSLVIVGCSTESQKVVSNEQKVVSKEHDEKAAHASVGKPSAPINMSYKVLTENPVPGQEIEIQVAFSSPLKTAISAEMKATEGLSMVSQEKSWSAEVSKSGEYAGLPNIKVVAPADGIYYVHLVAQVMEAGTPQFKPFTIPVKVGSGEVDLESPGEVVEDEKGQKVIIQKVGGNN